MILSPTTFVITPVCYGQFPMSQQNLTFSLKKNITVKPLYNGHQGDRNKCPYYRGVRSREVGFRTK